MSCLCLAYVLLVLFDNIMLLS